MAATAAKLPKSTAITTTPSSPPSSSSSPSHEFSFTISFHPSPPSTAPKSLVKGSKSSPASSAIDLSPADDIFFHGHLLPLHLLSRPPLISPRLSNVSSSGDNLGLPTPPAATTTTTTASSAAATTITTSIDQIPNTNSISTSTTVSSGGAAEGKEVKSRTSKSSSFTSLFGRRRKEEEEDKSKKKDKDKEKKKKFDVSRVLKKYATMVEALLFSRGARQKRDLSRRPYSFSGNSNWKGREEWIERRRKRWGQFSAPASMRTSPTNSGLLVATTNYASSEESTMEELQNAIQAAIAHCKNSIALKEKEKEKQIKEKEEEEEEILGKEKCS